MKKRLDFMVDRGNPVWCGLFVVTLGLLDDFTAFEGRVTNQAIPC